MGGRGNMWAVVLSAVIIVLIPISVLVLFTSNWWLAFIPLGIIMVSVIAIIVGYFAGMIERVERQENMNRKAGGSPHRPFISGSI
jgi:ABC-type bacteriocin/lantibiotic exporter with double-glycine peptidase domain